MQLVPLQPERCRASLQRKQAEYDLDLRAAFAEAGFKSPVHGAQL